jgi:sulfite dehydrogenase (quinone) subunit SoeC
LNPAYSVILFTTASGAGYGLLALLGLVGFNHGPASSMAFAITATFIALALITLGLLSSTLHLGHPERAWRAFSQWRSSWLSREGIAAVATYPAAIFFGAVWSGIIDAPNLIAPLGVLTAVMCMITVFCTAKIYSTLKTIRAWHNPLTVPVYLVFALATGAAVLMSIAADFGRYQHAQAVITLTAIALLGILKIIYWRKIDHETRTHTMAAATGLGIKSGESVRQWEVPHTNTNFIMKEMGFAVARKHALKLRRLALLLMMLAGGLTMISHWQPLISNFVAFVLLAAAWVERWLFFAEAEHVVGLFYGKQAA